MSRVALDASAIIAVLRKEPDYEQVLPHIPGSLISSINLAEVYCHMRKIGSDPEVNQQIIRSMKLGYVAFDDEQAAMVASIFQKTLGSSVGLADRACMALGLSQQLPVLTSDRDWLKHDIGVEVILFRNREAA